MIKAILYTSNTGTTKQYAKLIGEKTGLPVFSLEDAPKQMIGSEVIYLGWLMAGKVKGYKKAAKKYKVRALCAVGMGETGSQIFDIKKVNQISEGLPVFSMRGGFDITKLHGIYKFMMMFVKKTAGKKLSTQKNRTPEDDIMLDMIMNGRNYVSEENAAAILNWYHINH